MIIQQKIANIKNYASNKAIDWLMLEWYQTNKRILRTRTSLGEEVSLKFLNENPGLTYGDILFEDESKCIVVDVLPCDSLVISPANMFEMASVCYEIGNKHLPLFYEDDHLLVPFDQPLCRLLTAQGYKVVQAQKKLLQPLKTTVSPHGSTSDGQTLFSRIMKLTTGE